MSEHDMSARLSGRFDQPRALHLRRPGVSANSANDSPKQRDGTVKRVSAARVRRVGASLTDLDRQVVEILDTVNLATAGQLRRVLWGDGTSQARQSRRQLAKLTELQVVARLGRRIGGAAAGSEGWVYSLDVVGHRLRERPGRPRRPRTPGLTFLAHTVAITECYVQLREVEHQGQIELQDFETEPRCWRSFTGPGGTRHILKPDATVVVGTGPFIDHWYLEIDRATENPQRVADKAAEYVAHYHSGREQALREVYPKVLWVVPDERRKERLVAVLGAQRPENWRLFQVCTEDQFKATIAAGAGESAP